MFHHDQREYKVAASQAAKRGREKMEGIIQKGMATAEAVVGEIQSRIITDKVVRAPALRLEYDNEGERFLHVGAEPHKVHDHAYGQLLADTGVPKKYADYLGTEAGGDMWGKTLLADNVNAILYHRTKQRNLIRAEGETGTVKGFLSDKFRRLDSRPLCDAFIGACRELNLLPIEGVATDTKCRVRAVLPYVFEPVDNEVMIFGAEFGNSDYGDGGLVVNLWTMRVWCTNLAVTEKGLRQVHLGGRLPDDLHLSDKTYRLDAEATASVVRDVTSTLIGPDRVNRMLASVKQASEEEIKGKDGIDKLLGRALDKSELASVKALHESPDVQNMPEGNTTWRLSNAVSWFAQAKGVTADRKLELQVLAGQVFGAAMGNKPAVEV